MEANLNKEEMRITEVSTGNTFTFSGNITVEFLNQKGEVKTYKSSSDSLFKEKSDDLKSGTTVSTTYIVT